MRLKIERALPDELGAEVTVLLRTLSEVVGIVKRDPFKKNRVPRAKPFVTFMSETPGETPALPLRSRKGDVEVFEIVGTEAFSLSIEENGRFGFPNNFIEKEFGVPATTRNWNTVCKVAAALTRTIRQRGRRQLIRRRSFGVVLQCAAISHTPSATDDPRRIHGRLTSTSCHTGCSTGGSLARGVWIRNRWSIAECVAHLNLTTGKFGPAVREALDRGRRMGSPAPRRYRRNLMG